MEVLAAWTALLLLVVIIRLSPQFKTPGPLHSLAKLANVGLKRTFSQR